jgi:hypothetical protein
MVRSGWVWILQRGVFEDSDVQMFVDMRDFSRCETSPDVRLFQMIEVVFAVGVS